MVSLSDSDIQRFSSRLIAFVGPSGSGKDTLMAKVRDLILSQGLNCHIVERWITREHDETEGFHSVSLNEFFLAVSSNKFALHWHIYGNWYGVPWSEINDYLKEEIVLLNLSRAELAKLKEIYPLVRVVLVEVHTEIAEERIKQRKRDRGETLNERLKRLHESIELPLIPDLIVKNNARAINSTLIILLEFLRACYF